MLPRTREAAVGDASQAHRFVGVRDDPLGRSGSDTGIELREEPRAGLRALAALVRARAEQLVDDDAARLACDHPCQYLPDHFRIEWRDPVVEAGVEEVVIRDAHEVHVA